jgi:hypothetical protein
MKANAIKFANPMAKTYDILPPLIEELDDVYTLNPASQPNQTL